MANCRLSVCCAIAVLISVAWAKRAASDPENCSHRRRRPQPKPCCRDIHIEHAAFEQQCERFLTSYLQMSLPPSAHADSNPHSEYLNPCYEECMLDVSGAWKGDDTLSLAGVDQLVASIFPNDTLMWQLGSKYMRECAVNLYNILLLWRHNDLVPNIPYFVVFPNVECAWGPGVLLNCMRVQMEANCPAERWESSSNCNNTFLNLLRECYPLPHPHLTKRGLRIVA